MPSDHPDLPAFCRRLQQPVSVVAAAAFAAVLLVLPEQLLLLQQVLLAAPRQKAVPPATTLLSLPWVPVSPLWIQVMFTKSTHS